MVHKISSLRFLIITALFLIFSSWNLAYAQQTVSGTVTDGQSGETLPGVNILVKGTTIGTSTDANGKYDLSVESLQDTLVVSFIGYQSQEVLINGKSIVEITLNEQAIAGEEVIVTAYGVEQKINQLPYSAQKVSPEKVTQESDGNFLSALSGRVSGLKVQTDSGVGGSSNIILRGYNTLSGSNQALIVVDGVPYTNYKDSGGQGTFDYSLSNSGLDLNSDDIKSVTVLKGPSAAALYGSRASNGAIIIQTKDGAPTNENVDISFNSGVGVSFLDEKTIPKYQQEYGAGYADSFLEIDNPFTDDPNDKALAARYPDDASWGPAYDSNMNVYQWDSFYKGSPNYGKATPWTAPEHDFRSYFNTGVNFQNSLNISGNLANNGYYLIGYNQTNQRGAEPNSNVEDHKFSFKGGIPINKKFDISVSANFSKNSGKGRPGRGYGSEMTVIRAYGAVNVDWEKQKEAYFRNRQNETWNLTPDRSGPFFDNNPYWDRYENYQSDERKHFTGYGKAKYDVLDWLNLTARVAIDYNDQFAEYRGNVGSAAVSFYNRRSTQITEYNYDIFANYNKTLTQKINVDGTVGANIRRRFVDGIYAGTNGGLKVPRLFALSNSENSINFPGEADTKLGINGYFASLNVHYDDFLNLSLTGRRDKSSSLPANNNVYYYPSASLGFTFNRFIGIDWLSLAEVRGSWSQVGKTAPVHSLLDTYNRYSNFGSAAVYRVPGTKNNSNLKPEKTKSWEFGLQLGFLNNRVTFQGDYYDQKSTNQILAIPIDNSTGYYSKFINSGAIENRGIELSLDGSVITSNDFSWQIGVNWSKNTNKINSLAPGINFYQFGEGGGSISFGAQAGGSYGTIRGEDYVYKNGKRVVGSDGYYLKTESKNNVIGNQMPDWQGGINNDIKYKNFSLSFLIDVRAGGDIYSKDMWAGRGSGMYPITVGLNQKGNPKRDPVSEGGGILFDGVLEDGSPNKTYIPLSFSSGFNSRARVTEIYDGSYVKLRQAQFSYRLPKSLLKRSDIFDEVTFSVTGKNLWIIYKNLPYADPEQHYSADERLIGFQDSVYPAFRNITFSLKLNF